MGNIFGCGDGKSNGVCLDETKQSLASQNKIKGTQEIDDLQNLAT